MFVKIIYKGKIILVIKRFLKKAFFMSAYLARAGAICQISKREFAFK